MSQNQPVTSPEKMPTLREVAQRLPRMIKCDEAGNQISIQKTFKGIQLLKEGITSVDGPGGKKIPVKESKEYTTQFPYYVDHYKELKKLKRKGGWAAVGAYVQGCQKVPQQDKRVKKTERRAVQNLHEVKSVRTERPTMNSRWRAFWVVLKREIRRIFKKKSS